MGLFTYRFKFEGAIQEFSTIHFRAVARSENPWVPVLFGGHNLSPLVEIGLTDLPKSGCAMAHPAHPGTTGLHLEYVKMAFF